MGAVAAGLIIAPRSSCGDAAAATALGRPLAAAFAALTFVDDRAGCAGRWSGSSPASARIAVAHRLAAAAMSWRCCSRALSAAPTCSACSRHFLVLSLLAIGGAITTAPDMHRYVVDEHHWISDAQFSASIAIAQAAPGPNVLFVAVIGWNVAGPLGALATMAGTLLPSTALTLVATRWGAQRRETRGVRAFTTGLTPLTIGLLVATGWLLARPYVDASAHAPARSR